MPKVEDIEKEGRIEARVRAIVEEMKQQWEKEWDDLLANALHSRDEDELVALRVRAAKNAIIAVKISKLSGYSVYAEYKEDPSAQVEEAQELKVVSGEMSGVAEDGQVAGRGRQVDFECPSLLSIFRRDVAAANAGSLPHQGRTSCPTRPGKYTNISVGGCIQ